MQRSFRRTLLLSLLLTAASPALAVPLDPSKFSNASGNAHVVVESDPSQSYELYIPTTAHAPYTILYGFEPLGSGKNLLLLLDDAAKDQGWALAVSNAPTNSLYIDDLYDVEDRLLADTESRLNLDLSRHFATGFSGGSRVAMMFAGRYPDRFLGVLSMGAGDSGEYQNPLNPNAVVYGLAGRSDFNFTGGDIMRLQLGLLFDGNRCYVQPFTGGHVWPSNALVRQGLAWIAQYAGGAAGPNYELCDTGAAFSNSPEEFAWGRWNSQLNGDHSCYQRIGHPPGKVTAITWWGDSYRYNASDGSYTGCPRVSESFRVAFLLDANGEPSDSVWAQTVTPQREYTGHVFWGEEVYRYRYEPPVPIDLGDARWLRIAGATTADGCQWAWEGYWLPFPPALQLYVPDLGQPGAYATLDTGLAVCVETDSDVYEAEDGPEGGYEGFFEGGFEGWWLEGWLDGEGTPGGEGAPEGAQEGSAEGLADGGAEGTMEGMFEGEGAQDGEGGAGAYHSTDTDHDRRFSLSELLRVIQLFSMGGYHCAAEGDPGEDPYAAGNDDGARACPPCNADYSPQDWKVALGELLRQVQFFNADGYQECGSGEDGFCTTL